MEETQPDRGNRCIEVVGKECSFSDESGTSTWLKSCHCPLTFTPLEVLTLPWCRFRPQVRSYAIETLSGAPDEELRLYLLQLVQALKYEEDVSGGTSNNNGGVSNVFSHPANEGNTTRVSSLATFLIDRASRNVKLANFLYW